MTKSYLEEFCASYNLKNLIKQPTSFKNLENLTRIDHILTNHPKSFHSPSVLETGLSDFHKLTLTVLKSFHAKHKPEIIQYRNFNNFDDVSFRADILQKYLFKMFTMEILRNLNAFPRKNLRCNQSPFMKKQLRKTIITRTRLRNKCRKYNSDRNLTAYKRQKYLC